MTWDQFRFVFFSVLVISVPDFLQKTLDFSVFFDGCGAQTAIFLMRIFFAFFAIFAEIDAQAVGPGS